MAMIIKPEQYKRIKQIFLSTCDLDLEMRAAVLDEACGEDAALRATVESLLIQHDDPSSLLSEYAVDHAKLPGPTTLAADAARGDAHPEQLGAYRIKRVIATGGMSVVYEAVQEKPRRVVVLKVMKAGIASKSALRRFEYESQVLARLRHSAVAQVYEAGTQSDGETVVPFFALEYIPNARLITDYAREKKLGTRERLELFTQVCAAVHHGHQKGIIHRDLKPSNILVDSQGQVKIIDFGVARATDSDMAITTLQTDVGQLIGTVQYMSPEQVEANPHDLDVRSDIYALGVVLYELLCDQLPYDVRKAAIYEAVRIIREQEPAKLSVLNRTLRCDIETITLRALEKDRTRRYQSADEFGSDIQRYLVGEAISARPPSMIYQLRIFARRNKAAFAAIAAVFVILTTATIFSTWQYILADAARADAVAGWNEAKEKRKEAEDARNEAADEKRERKKTEAMLKLLTKALVSSDPNQGGTQGFLVTAAMEQVIGFLDAGELKDQPEFEAALLLTISEILNGNARSQEALRLARRALEINEQLHPGDHHDVALSLNSVARCLESLGRSVEALPKFESALEIYQRLFPGDHSDVAVGLNGVANCLQSLGRSAEALSKHEAALEMNQRLFGGDHPAVAASLNNVAGCLESLGRLAEALSKFEAALEMRQRLFQGDHPDVAASLNNVAGCLESLSRWAEALPKSEAALEMQQRLFPDDHPGVAASLNNVALCLRSLGRSAEALSKFEAALEMHSRLFQGNHPGVALSLNNVAASLESLGRSEEALPKYEAALEMFRRVLPPGHPHTLYPQIGLAKTLVSLGRHADAEPFLLDGYERMKDHPTIPAMRRQEALKRIVNLYEAWNKPDQAAEWRAKLPAEETEESAEVETE